MGKANRINHYLRPIRASQRRQIRRVFVGRLMSGGIGRLSGGGYPCNARTRVLLADSIFQVEDERESRSGGQADDPLVVEMRSARNRVYDDLGWNEDPGLDG